MASRENQGLHIALILLIMLSVGLCVFLYVFYSQSERFRVEAETARTKAAQDGKALGERQLHRADVEVHGQRRQQDLDANGG